MAYKAGFNPLLVGKQRYTGPEFKELMKMFQSLIGRETTMKEVAENIEKICFNPLLVGKQPIKPLYDQGRIFSFFLFYKYGIISF